MKFQIRLQKCGYPFERLRNSAGDFILGLVKLVNHELEITDYVLYHCLMQVPPPLKPGDKVAIVATSSAIPKDAIDGAKAQIESWGFNCEIYPNVLKTWRTFAGTDDERAEDLQSAIDDPTVNAILFARGGYGVARTMRLVNIEPLFASPKWLIGFSDITELHCTLQTSFPESFATIHGMMAIQFGPNGFDQDSIHWTEKVLKGNELNYQISSCENNRLGLAKGSVIGGNLAMFHNWLAGSEKDINFADKLLFLEDVGEKLYKIDRMLLALDRRGIFHQIEGLIIADFTNMEDSIPSFASDVFEVIQERIAEYNFPVLFNFPAGHGDKNYPIRLGMEATIEVTEKGASFYQAPL